MTEYVALQLAFWLVLLALSISFARGSIGPARSTAVVGVVICAIQAAVAGAFLCAR